MPRKPAPHPGKTVDLSPLWRVAGFNLRMLDVRMMRTTGARLARVRLTPAAATVLLVLQANPGLPVGRLADVLLVQRPNMTKLVKRLEARRLIYRGTAPGDGRRIALGLTASGRRLAARVISMLDEHDAQALAVLDPAEREQLLDFVGRVIAGLERRGNP